MKIGMKEDMGVADKMTLSNLGLPVHSVRNCARSVPKHTNSQFMVTGSEGLQ